MFNAQHNFNHQTNHNATRPVLGSTPAPPKLRSIAKQITTSFIWGAALLLLIYNILFRTVIHQTENQRGEVRLEIVSQAWLADYEKGATGTIERDVLSATYEHYDALPHYLQRRIEPSWQGRNTFHLSDEREFAVYAKDVAGVIRYAVEDADASEWPDDTFLMIEMAITLTGVFLFLISAGLIYYTASRIAAPFRLVTQQIQQRDALSASKRNSTTSKRLQKYIAPSDTHSKELHQLVTALNDNSQQIQDMLQREQNFTRYVSHELRTPMTIIKGSLSILKKKSNEVGLSPQFERATHALENMQALVSTFLELARDLPPEHLKTTLSDASVRQQINQLDSLIDANNCQVRLHFSAPFSLTCHPILFEALFRNTLCNAISHTPHGEVAIFISEQQLEIVDNGKGLNTARNNEQGYGIGLILVQDICEKYGWKFFLSENIDGGCTCLVQFQYDESPPRQS